MVFAYTLNFPNGAISIQTVGVAKNKSMSISLYLLLCLVIRVRIFNICLACFGTFSRFY